MKSSPSSRTDVAPVPIVPSLSELVDAEQTHELIGKVFKRHGGIKIRMPWIDYDLHHINAADSDDAVDVLFTNGTNLSLPYDLRLPFAKYLAQLQAAPIPGPMVQQQQRAQPTIIKRFDLGPVYRKNNFELHPKEFFIADFDIVLQKTTSTPPSNSGTSTPAGGSKRPLRRSIDNKHTTSPPIGPISPPSYVQPNNVPIKTPSRVTSAPNSAPKRAALPLLAPLSPLSSADFSSSETHSNPNSTLPSPIPQARTSDNLLVRSSSQPHLQSPPLRSSGAIAIPSSPTTSNIITIPKTNLSSFSKSSSSSNLMKASNLSQSLKTSTSTGSLNVSAPIVSQPPAARDNPLMNSHQPLSYQAPSMLANYVPKTESRVDFSPPDQLANHHVSLLSASMPSQMILPSSISNISNGTFEFINGSVLIPSLADKLEVILAEAEVIKVATEVMDQFSSFMPPYYIRINHTALLEAFYDLCGIEPDIDTRSSVSSIIGTLGKSPWSAVRGQLISELSLTEPVVDDLQRFVQIKGEPKR